MRTHKLFLSALFAVTLATAGTEVSHTRYRNETARAEYSWIENGCVSKQLVVTAAKNSVRQDGTLETQPVATVMYSIYDFCDAANVSQTFWWGTGNAFSLTVAFNLKSASMIAPAFPMAGERFNGPVRTDLGTKQFNIDIRWSSNDPLDKSAGTWVTRLPGYLEVSTFNGWYRLATATGVVSDGTQNLFPVAYEGNLVQLYRVLQGETILTRE